MTNEVETGSLRGWKRVHTHKIRKKKRFQRVVITLVLGKFLSPRLKRREDLCFDSKLSLLPNSTKVRKHLKGTRTQYSINERKQVSNHLAHRGTPAE